MLNQTVLVGRLVQDPEIKELENDKKACNITLAVTRSYKNADWIYENDFIPITLWQGIAENVKEHCKKGDLVGVRGRLQAREDKVEVVGEKVTFLSSKAKEEE